MKKTLIVIPCFDTVKTAFFNSFIKLRKTPGASYVTVENTMVHDSRNIAAENAIQAGFDRVMWFDSDMEFEPDTLEALERDMDENGLDFVSGLYFTRRLPDIKPVVFKEMSFEWLEDGTYEAISKFYFDYPRDQLFECAGVGFGCCLTSVDLLKRVTERYGAPFNPMPSMGEDVSFCLRARKLGVKLFCDSRVKCGHVGQAIYDEKYYHGKTTWEVTHDFDDNKEAMRPLGRVVRCSNCGYLENRVIPRYCPHCGAETQER